MQYAIQWKLTQQLESDSSVDELLAKIKTEKERLIKEWKIKKEKPLAPITDDEKPFEIPSNWRWVKLWMIAEFNWGFAFKSTEYVKEWNWIRVLRISDFNEHWLVNKSPVYIPYDEKLETYELSESDIVMCMTWWTVWKSYLFRELKEKMYVNQRVADIKCNTILNVNYVYIVILSNHIQSIIGQNKNSTNDNISADLIRNFIIPIPPIEEQQRIVDRVECFMKLSEWLNVRTE